MRERTSMRSAGVTGTTVVPSGSHAWVRALVAEEHRARVHRHHPGAGVDLELGDALRPLVHDQARRLPGRVDPGDQAGLVGGDQRGAHLLAAQQGADAVAVDEDDATLGVAVHDPVAERDQVEDPVDRHGDVAQVEDAVVVPGQREGVQGRADGDGAELVLLRRRPIGVAGRPPGEAGDDEHQGQEHARGAPEGSGPAPAGAGVELGQRGRRERGDLALVHRRPGAPDGGQLAADQRLDVAVALLAGPVPAGAAEGLGGAVVRLGRRRALLDQAADQRRPARGDVGLEVAHRARSGGTSPAGKRSRETHAPVSRSQVRSSTESAGPVRTNPGAVSASARPTT